MSSEFVSHEKKLAQEIACEYEPTDHHIMAAITTISCFIVVQKVIKANIAEAVLPRSERIVQMKATLENVQAQTANLNKRPVQLKIQRQRRLIV